MSGCAMWWSANPDGTHGGVVQYDIGKNYGDDHFIRIGALKSPPRLLLTALANLRAGSDLGKSQLEEFLNEAYRIHPYLISRAICHPALRRIVLNVRSASRCVGSGSSGGS